MEQTLKKIMIDLFGITENEIDDNSSMDNIQKWDSLKHIEFILSIEEVFEIPQLSVDEIAKMTSVAEIKRILINKGIKLGSRI